MGHGELEQNTKEDDKIYKARKSSLIQHMTCTVQTHIETYCGLSKNKTCKTVDNTHHTSMVCVYTEKIILVIDILDTFIQKLIQTYKGPTKKKTIYKLTIHKHHALDKHKNIYMHAYNKDSMHACICRKVGWKAISRFMLSTKTNFSDVLFQVV